MGWFSEIFRPEKRDQSYTGNTPQGLSSFPETTALRTLASGIGQPASFADMYERELANPRRNVAIRDFTQNTVPTINQAYSARGLGHSTLPARDIGNARTDMGLQLAMARGQDRTRGLDRGFQQQGFKAGVQQDLLGRDVAQSNASAAFDWGKYLNEQKQAEARVEARRKGFGQLVEYGGNLALMGMTGGLSGLGSAMGGQAVTGVAGGMTGAMAGMPRTAMQSAGGLSTNQLLKYKLMGLI